MTTHVQSYPDLERWLDAYFAIVLKADGTYHGDLTDTKVAKIVTSALRQTPYRAFKVTRHKIENGRDRWLVARNVRPSTRRKPALRLVPVAPLPNGRVLLEKTA